MELAPIVLFTYNRPWHTEQTLIALKNNVLANESLLYVFSDGPKIDGTSEVYTKVEEVRKIVKKEKWCKEVELVERHENFGLARNVIGGVTEIIKKYGKVIVLEDDIVTGTYFLNYMNDALNLYEKDNKVFGVSGYQYPVKNKIKSSTYFLPISSSWSYGTWRDRWNKVEFESNELKDRLQKLDNYKSKLNFNGYPFYEMFIDQLNGKIDSWAIRFYVSMFLENGLFLYPNKSLVKNIGIGISNATHTKSKSHFGEVIENNYRIEVSKINSTTVEANLRKIELIKNVNAGASKNNSRLYGLIKSAKSKFNRIFGLS